MTGLKGVIIKAEFLEEGVLLMEGPIKTLDMEDLIVVDQEGSMEGLRSRVHIQLLTWGTRAEGEVLMVAPLEVRMLLVHMEVVEVHQLVVEDSSLGKYFGDAYTKFIQFGRLFDEN